jgi:hypothetical protein
MIQKFFSSRSSGCMHYPLIFHSIDELGSWHYGNTNPTNCQGLAASIEGVKQMQTVTQVSTEYQTLRTCPTRSYAHGSCFAKSVDVCKRSGNGCTEPEERFLYLWLCWTTGGDSEFAKAVNMCGTLRR